MTTAASLAIATPHTPNHPPADLRTLLKAATTDLHEQLDRRLTGGDFVSLSGYRRFLEINAAALIPIEETLAGAGVANVIPDWGARARTTAIKADLAAVGGHFDPLPYAPSLSPHFGILGAAYVLEGSRLGAKYLLRAIEASDDARVAGATAYLRHGAGQHLWQSFLDVLKAQTPSPGDISEAVEGARKVFEVFMQAAERA
jgi:heme oxygenase (biliverdin-IX-beta and delta-forming)